MHKNVINIVIMVVLALAFFSPAASQPVRAQESQTGDIQSEGLQSRTDRIIVKYKEGTDASFAPSLSAQMERMEIASKQSLVYVREMSNETHVLELNQRMAIEQVEAIATQLETLPEVEYAEPDRIYQPFLSPNDTYYSSQWNLSGTWGINAPTAWDETTGSTSIVIAVVDTGITGHADINARLVPGYDFIGPDGSGSQTANDGDGRDSNPSDPGDWITPAENASGFFKNCPVTDSTWHGTHVAGIIGAESNNNSFITGVDWNAKILPVRVLGKCGGYMSDIMDGMRWAAGLSVSGVPNNPNPADIINLSLGGSGTCSTTAQSAITEIVNAGVIVVVAAGNENKNVSNSSPANCVGVIAVAATDSAGQRASFSNYGIGIDISAPGTSILSLVDSGTTVPAGDSSAYYGGTSMAAPQVSGVLGLMLARNPSHSLTPSQALAMLQSSAKPFPGGGTCTTSNCGSGIVNAVAAVALNAYTFADVPVGAFAQPQIESIYAYGITGGCGTAPLIYCPGSSVTRAQMAVFLLRGIHGPGYSPPAATGVFADVPNNDIFAAWIERFAAEGITSGCGGGNYCPSNSVTRAQMAVFLLRAKHGAGYTPPAAIGMFADVPSNTAFAPWIEQLANESITSGCGGGNYCPDKSVTRAEMAVFIQKTFGLPLP